MRELDDEPTILYCWSTQQLKECGSTYFHLKNSTSQFVTCGFDQFEKWRKLRYTAHELELFKFNESNSPTTENMNDLFCVKQVNTAWTTMKITNIFGINGNISKIDTCLHMNLKFIQHESVFHARMQIFDLFWFLSKSFPQFLYIAKNNWNISKHFGTTTKKKQLDR